MQAKDLNDRTILHRAALEQNIEVLNDLIGGNKNFEKILNLKDIFGNTPILLCCCQNFEKSKTSRIECLKFLKSKGADPNIKNRRTRWSCLHWCAYYGDFESVSFLLLSEQAKYDSCIPDYKGYYPLDLAAKEVKYNKLNKK